MALQLPQRSPAPSLPVESAASWPESPLSPGLARLLNAALMDSTFAAHFIAAPVTAARQAIEASSEVFGTLLPSPALRLSLPDLTDAEWAVLRRLPRTESLADTARLLRRLAAGVGGPTTQDVHNVHAVREIHELRLPLSAPASPEGALAGAA